ncbi:MAG: hypothetical protein ACP5NW_04070 [Candidatus Woesearchaeota archaeon]
MAKAPQVPFQELNNEIAEYRSTLSDIIKKHYSQARSEDKSLGYDRVQNNIYTEFISTMTLDRIKRFCKSYHTILEQRERILKEHVEQSIKELKNWEKFNTQTKKWEKYNSNLKERYFLKVIARYDGEIVREKITPVEKYLSEAEIEDRTENYSDYHDLKAMYDEEIIRINKSKLSKKEKVQRLNELKKHKPKEYLPSFTDIPNFDYNKLEIMAAINGVVLVDRNQTIDDRLLDEVALKAIKFEKNEYDIRTYVRLARTKRSKREVSKLVDTLITDEGGILLRAEDDRAYDTIASTFKVNSGEEMYRWANRIIDTSTEYPEFDNMHTQEENSKLGKDALLDPTSTKKRPLQKLRKDFYVPEKTGVRPHMQLDTENYKDVMQQMLTTEKIVNQKIRLYKQKNKTYRLNKEEREALRQGIKIGHTIGKFTMETQIGVREMLWIQQYGLISHSGHYFTERDLIREEYLLNPALSPARKAIEKAKALKVNDKKQHNAYRNKTKDVSPERLARVDTLAHLLERLFLPAFQLRNY